MPGISDAMLNTMLGLQHPAVNPCGATLWQATLPSYGQVIKGFIDMPGASSVNNRPDLC